MLIKMKKIGLVFVFFNIISVQGLMADILFYYNTAVLSSVIYEKQKVKNLIAGQVLYTTIENQMGTLESWAFNQDASQVTWQELEGGSDTGSGTLVIDGMTIYYTEESEQTTIVVVDILDDYLLVSIDGGEEQRLYFDEAKARAYFLNPVAGVWSIVDDYNFSYLTLYNDGRFSYAENDTEASEPENGMEAGTYVYDSVNDAITFNITYDDNAPGEDSGIGDPGENTVTAVLSSDKSILTLAGELNLQARSFSTDTSPIVGAWKYDASDGAFSYLTLFEDGTFMYAENDTGASEPENGLETGTYVYDSANSMITFNITYDDNAPGDDSGIGDKGENDIDAVLSNGNNTLSIAGGAIVFERAF